MNRTVWNLFIASVVVLGIFLALVLSTCVPGSRHDRGSVTATFYTVHDKPLVETVKGYCDLVSVGATEIRYGDEVYILKKNDLEYSDRQRLSLWLRVP